MSRYIDERESLAAWRLATSGTNDEELDRLKRALPKVLNEYVTPLQRLYIQEFFGGGLNEKQIAEKYGRDRSTVSRTLHRGLNRLYYYLKLCRDDLGESLPISMEFRLTQKSIQRGKPKRLK